MSELATTAKENAVAKEDPGKRTVLEMIRQQQAAIEMALPKGMDAERFTRIALTEVRRTPALLKCDPMSFLGALMLSAQLGLEPGPLGHAYFLPFKRQVTFVIGYKGMIDLARRSGQIESIVGRAVYENDTFNYAFGLEDTLEHVPATDDRGELTYVYGLAKFKDGGHAFEVLSRDDVESYRKRSPSAKASHSPWKTDYDAMAVKTAIRRLFRWLPVTAEAAQAFTVADEAPVHGISTDIMADLELDAPDDTDDIEDAEIVEEDE